MKVKLSTVIGFFLQKIDVSPPPLWCQKDKQFQTEIMMIFSKKSISYPTKKSS